MSDFPKTLLQMAGANLTPPPLKDAALVIVDAQNEYWDGKLKLPGVEPAVAAIERLLTAARKAGSPIIHVVHHGAPGGAVFDPEGHGGAIVAPLTPQEGEPVCPKSLPNSFTSKAFLDALESTGVAEAKKQLIIVGFMAHMCISSTARAALDHGYFSIIPADAVADRPLPDILTDNGKGIQNPDNLIRAELAALGDRFSLIVPSVDDLI